MDLFPDTQDLIQVKPQDLIALKRISLPGASEAQRSLSPTHLNALLQSNLATWPPVIVTKTSRGLLLLDGYHRTEATKRLGLPTISATVQAFATLEDAIEFAFQANLSHGLPSSSNTRSDYAYWLFCTYPDLPQTEIARRAGITPATVNVALKRRTQQAEEKRKLTSSKLEERWDVRGEQRKKELDRTIRRYVRESQHLYTLLNGLDTSGQRYWALQGAIDEGEKVVLFRLLQFLQDFLKQDLPADLTKSLSPPTRPRRSRTTKPPDEEQLEEHPPEES